MHLFPSSGIEHTALALHDDISHEDAFGEFLIALTIDEHADAVKAGDQAAARESLAKYARMIKHRSPEQIAHLERARGLIA